jgi:hypothetical protein
LGGNLVLQQTRKIIQTQGRVSARGAAGHAALARPSEWKRGSGGNIIDRFDYRHKNAPFTALACLCKPILAKNMP